MLANSNPTAVGYWDKIFRPIVRPYAGAMSPGFLLVLDNAWPRVAKVSWMMRALIPLAGPHVPQRLESNLQPQGLYVLLPNNTTDCPGTLIQVWKEIPPGNHPLSHQENDQMLGVHMGKWGPYILMSQIMKQVGLDCNFYL